MPREQTETAQNSSDPDEIWNKLFTRVEKESNVPVIHIGIIGNSDVGKTSLVYKFLNKNFKLQPIKTKTIGTDIQVMYLSINDKQVVKVKIFDTAGQERMGTIV